MENIEQVIRYMSEYGTVFLFVIVFLEYMNLPGLPAGIIMPAAGLLVARNSMHFSMALILSVVAGLLGSYVLYGIGYYVGHPLLDKVYQRYEKLQSPINKTVGYMDKYGNRGLLISRLIPVARTLIALVVGTTRMKLVPFTVYSILGITVWNATLITTGYVIGRLAF